MNLPFKKNIFYENETEKIATEFSNSLIGGDVVLLNGELGSGKTFFVKSVCKNYGINNVNSPSFAIVNEYSGKYKIYHFDFFRVKKSNELEDIGFDDYLNDENAIVFIEWADMFANILPQKNYKVNFNFLENGYREINITKS
ncbi:MAG: tRNA (adenosine(37)-N6)-threonylcarbamoyltransferase complex ATPase subunit type 1 TsaE [bacterium]